MFRYQDDNIILKTILKVLIPFVFILGGYVLVNGHLSPGGGFSGGTVLAAGLIMYDIAYGGVQIKKFFNFTTFRYISVIALALYGLLKGLSFMVGAAGGSLGIPVGTPGSIFSGGLIPILNIAVGLVVMATIYLIFDLFSKGDI